MTPPVPSHLSADLSALAARALRRARAAIQPRSHGADDELTAAVEGALCTKKHRRRRRRTAVLAVAAAACAGIGWLVLRPAPAPPPTAALRPSLRIVAAGPVPPEATLADGAGRRPLRDGALIGRGARIATPRTRPVAVRLSTGTRLRVRGELEVLDASDTQWFELRAGSLDAEVAKLRHGERFLVRAGSADIEVWGTAFEVGLGAPCGGKPRTELVVREGVVAVRAAGEQHLVRAGERWQSECAAAPALQARRRPVARATAASAGPASSLGAQNQLFLEAVQARQRGETAAALRMLDHLLGVHPEGPLSEAAMAERMRLLRGRDQDAAVAAARVYLRRFPAGFARGEAEALARGR